MPALRILPVALLLSVPLLSAAETSSRDPDHLQLQPAQAIAGAPGSTGKRADLDRELQEATWPADIVRIADECLAHHWGGGGCEKHATEWRREASATDQILQTKQVQLQRDAFVDDALSPAQREAVRRAALGDAAAAADLAHSYRAGGEAAAPSNPFRYVGWLEFATQLGNKEAAYELAIHFRAQGQPALASVYEARAIAMGYVPPKALDHVRK